MRNSRHCQCSRHIPKKEGSITVTPEIYIRAETDRSFGNMQALAGGVNRFYQVRQPTPLVGQTVIRMSGHRRYVQGRDGH